jgi:histone-lysine N-methyltransferase SETMAR
MSLEDDERSGRPSTTITPENVEQIQELVHADHQRTINDTADIVGVSYGSVQTILTSELNMRCVAAKFVPRLLTPEQKEHRVTVCQDLCERAADNPSFMSRIITGDESWVYGYDPETKRQSSQWKSPSSPRPKKARMSCSSMKTMFIVFFDIRGIVHREFVPQGQTVNKTFYCEVLRRLRENIRRK